MHYVNKCTFRCYITFEAVNTVIEIFQMHVLFMGFWLWQKGRARHSLKLLVAQSQNTVRYNFPGMMCAYKRKHSRKFQHSKIALACSLEQWGVCSSKRGMRTKGWIYKLQLFISLSLSFYSLTGNKALVVFAQELVYTGGILREHIHILLQMLTL